MAMEDIKPNIPPVEKGIGDFLGIIRCLQSISNIDGDLPPKKESSYNVSKLGQKRGDKWQRKPSLRSKSLTS